MGCRNKKVKDNDDKLKDILSGTAATKGDTDRLAMQYMIEWNYGKAGDTASTTLSPLKTADFTAHFSKGQTLVPDTIKVFRVYQPDAVTADGEWVSIGSSYGKIIKHEDPAFEQFLKEHLTVTTLSDGVTKNLSWQDYQEQLNMAKENGTEPLLVNGIYLHEDDMYHVMVDGKEYNFAENHGNNTDKSVATPHSTFFIQMDTLLDANMPEEWTKPGNGPSITYNKVSGDFDGNGTTDRSTSPVFQDGGNGFSHEITYKAVLHFADVNDKDNIISLDSDHGVSPLDGYDQEHASADTPITFENAAQAIQQLEKENYKFIGISRGDKTSGSYNGSDLCEAKDGEYLDDQYGKYGDKKANEGTKYNFEHQFTLNFVHDTKPVTETKTITETISYVDEKNGEN